MSDEINIDNVEEHVPENLQSCADDGQSTEKGAPSEISDAVAEAKGKKKKKPIALIIGAVVVVAAVIAAIIFMGGHSGSGSSGKGENPLFREGLLTACTDGKWGYIDKTGSYVINPQFDDAYSFADNGFAVVEVGGKYGFIDKTGAYVVNPMYADMGSSVYSGCIYFANDDKKVGYLDTSGKEIIPAQFDYIYSSKYSSFNLAGNFYDDGFAVVRMGNSFGVIDKEGNYVINPQFDGLDGRSNYN